MPPCPRCAAESSTAARTCAQCGSPLHPGTLVMAAASTPRPYVCVRVVRADGGPETVLTMQKDVLLCGRQGEIPLVDDPFVAPVQARFFFNGERLVVEDVGGGNGVFIRLRQEQELPIGGELRVGRQRLVLEPLAPEALSSDGVAVWGSPDAKDRFRLVQMLEGGGRGAAFPLHEGENLLGREAGDITFLTDGFVSGRHALLTVHADRLRVRDVGSSNGTFIRLTAPLFVDHGDQFLIGRQLLRIELQA